MKKPYETAKIEILRFKTRDVLADSGTWNGETPTNGGDAPEVPGGAVLNFDPMIKHLDD